MHTMGDRVFENVLHWVNLVERGTHQLPGSDWAVFPGKVKVFLGSRTCFKGRVEAEGTCERSPSDMRSN